MCQPVDRQIQPSLLRKSPMRFSCKFPTRFCTGPKSTTLAQLRQRFVNNEWFTPAHNTSERFCHRVTIVTIAVFCLFVTYSAPKDNEYRDEFTYSGKSTSLSSALTRSTKPCSASTCKKRCAAYPSLRLVPNHFPSLGDNLFAPASAKLFLVTHYRS